MYVYVCVFCVCRCVHLYVCMCLYICVCICVMTRAFSCVHRRIFTSQSMVCVCAGACANAYAFVYMYETNRIILIRWKQATRYTHSSRHCTITAIVIISISLSSWLLTHRVPTTRKLPYSFFITWRRAGDSIARIVPVKSCELFRNMTYPIWFFRCKKYRVGLMYQSKCPLGSSIIAA